MQNTFFCKIISSMACFIHWWSIVLSSVITLYLFCHHNDGWLLHTRIVSCGGYAFFQVHKILKQINLTFGYVGLAHWAIQPEGKGKGKACLSHSKISRLRGLKNWRWISGVFRTRGKPLIIILMTTNIVEESWVVVQPSKARELDLLQYISQVVTWCSVSYLGHHVTDTTVYTTAMIMIITAGKQN